MADENASAGSAEGGNATATNTGTNTGTNVQASGTGTENAGTNTGATTTTTTVAGSKPGDVAQATTPSDGGYWPQDWRDKVSKGDEKLAARFGRYASPEAALTALIAAQNKISSGELKPVLGKDASAQEIADYRKSIGIPETPDKYDLNLGNGFSVKEDDKPLVEAYLQAAHKTNQTPEQVKASMQAFYSMQQKQTELQAEKDFSSQQEGEETLRAEWGGEFRRNINLVHGLLDGVFPDTATKDKFLIGRLADGTPIGSDPAVLKALVGLALINNPTGVVVPGAAGNQMAGLEDEIGKIEKVMKENRPAYNKDEKMQARYRDLLGAREAMQARKVA